MIALLNGRSTSAVPVVDRGLAYGDGLFETIKVVDGHAQFLTEHLARLSRDCRRLAMQLDLASLRTEIARISATADEGILKLIITRGATMRGYQASPSASAQRLLIFFPQHFPPLDALPSGVQVRLCRQRLAEQPSLAGMKHLNRLEQVMARGEWSDPAIAEGLMMDRCSRLIEGVASNLFLVRTGTVYTPCLHRCGVAGVIRDLVLNKMAPDCAPVLEADLILDDLYAADEVFLSNSLIGIMPVLKIDCLHKARGDVTIAFQQCFQKLCLQESIANECR
ncbi:MAG TPA: aminodeoxychorismate lyase [Spongiibacteraceae bacterium]|nr:aminodeoxychorismate lyase [Spongiibacteraceae bacterium]